VKHRCCVCRDCDFFLRPSCCRACSKEET